MSIYACRAAIGLALLVIPFFAASFFLAQWLEDRQAVADPCPGALGETSACWDEYYAQVITTRGPLTALKDLKAQYEKGGGGRLFCHPILHEIGEAAGEQFGSMEEAFRHGDPVCRSGYYHGVLEYLFGEEGGETLLSQLDSICAETWNKERYSYDYFACVHGIGHGLMAYFDHELFQSLAGCELLTGQWEQSTCAGGAFMENIGADSPEFPSKYLKKDDLIFPCNAVKEQYRPQCFQMQSSYMLVQNGGDFGAAFATCRDVEEPYQEPCYQSIGRDASGWSYGDAETARALCSVGTTANERTQCLIGAASDFIQSVGISEARAFCTNSGKEAHAACVQAVEWQIRAL
ncbi:hypothetical protein A3A38_00645 [Candidatus Kaiserbacteria bacterium RIFCSPLOWO2_01_FULL_53_17]|uniref:Uncharacterized protein n=1 Tax=Candidatus Kaiserbacteria bacterium RIFCSPLOWO2_01_FULL_53_17 TaxID=1798511 RepID=A0A1F6EGT1_9BACT|nr:MAG: hypothetical protein A3A38_00645 [Candidatus Kaiserbacteria bacterium RIFCSPLOWO2_01_FULL_53_17]